MTTPTLSVQLYTVREAFDADPAGTLQRLADLGFRTVEPAKFAERVDLLEPALQAAGLAAASGHTKLIGADAGAAFAAARRLGIRLVIEPMGDRARWSTAEDVVALAAELNAVVDEAEAAGLTIGYHNHAYEFEALADGRVAYDVFVAALDERIVLEIDTYWVAVAGFDPVEVVTRYAERTALMHIKDGPITVEKLDQLPVGDGAMPIAALLAAAPDAIAVVELDDYRGDVFDALTRSFAHLSKDLDA